MSVERKIVFRYNDERLTFLGTLEGLWESYPGARILKMSYNPSASPITTWRAIPGYQDLYEISNRGLVKRLKNYSESEGKVRVLQARILKEHKGYVVLTKDGVRSTLSVRHLLALTFNL